MSQQQHHRVDPKIWHKLAGDSLTVPKLHSKVYYFPQGHLQHVCPNTQPLDGCRPLILCTVSAVDLLADPETDQVYAKLLLSPVIDGSVVPLESDNEADGDQIVSYAKTLTNTDVRSGAVLYIPRVGAESILPALPPLDSRNESRFQNILVNDVCGVAWEFRHVYRRYPFQHLFTIGWSGFVSKKKLVVGDTVVFVKNSAGNISVGIRRKEKLAAAAKMTEKEVKMAVELAEKNSPFEIVYYPTFGSIDFVVGAETVEDAMKVNWDDPDVPENLKQLSPWQVELINSNRPISDIQFPPTKKLRGAQGSVLSTDQNISNSHTSSILNSFKTKNADIHNCNNKKTKPGSIMLFGKMIQPIERELYDSDIIGDNSCKRSNEVEDIDKTC